MSKKRARIRFVWLAIVVAIGLFLAVCPFDIPFTNLTYHGFAGNISLGLDLSGGISVVYDCTPSANSTNSDLSAAVDATAERLEQVLYNEGYSEAKVFKQGANRIRIEVPDVSDSSEVFGFLENPQTLYMTLQECTDASNPPEALISGYDIENVYVSMQNDSYGVSLRFTEEGTKKFADLTTQAADSSNTNHYIYIYLGEVNPNNLFGTVTCENAITNGSTFISGDSITDLNSAREYAYNIMSGTFAVQLELVENNIISATLGRNALTYGIIAGVVALALIMVIMWIRYGDFGLLADFSLVVYVVLMLFFLQAIPFVQLTLPGLAGIVLSLGMAVDGNIIIFERIKEEYAKGKKIPLAVKSGFKRAFWPIFDSNITTIFTSVILYILGTASIKGFALTLLLGILLSMFTNLVITRFFVKSYLPLNSTKTKQLRLHREKGVVEIKEEPQPAQDNGVNVLELPQTPDSKTGGEK